MSWTTREKPRLTRLSAIGSPMAPRPMNPTVPGMLAPPWVSGSSVTPDDTPDRVALHPAAVHHVALVGAGPAVVGGQEEDDARDVLGQELPLETLPAQQLLLALRREPPRDLPLGHDPAGHDGIDPDVPRAEVAGERPGQPDHRRLGAEIRRHPALPDH